MKRLFWLLILVAIIVAVYNETSAKTLQSPNGYDVEEVTTEPPTVFNLGNKWMFYCAPVQPPNKMYVCTYITNED
jgi:hypothetical protein